MSLKIYSLFFLITLIIQSFSHADMLLNEIQRATLLYQHINPNLTISSIKSAQLQNLLPQLRFSLKRNNGEKLNVENSNIQIDMDLNYDVSFSFEISATWQLSHLLHNPQTFRIKETYQNEIKRRNDIISHVNSLYFKRLQAIKNNEGSVNELTAEINIYCGNCIK